VIIPESGRLLIAKGQYIITAHANQKSSNRIKILTRQQTRQQSGQQRCLKLRVNDREHAEHETVFGHGHQNPRHREHTR